MNLKAFKIQVIGSIEDNEHLRLSDFIEQLRSIKEALVELDRKVSQSQKPTTDYRIIDVSHSSPVSIELEAIPNQSECDNTSLIIDRFFEGIQQINTGSAPVDFDSALLEHFGRIGQGFRRKITGLIFSRENCSIQIGRTFEAQVTSIVGEDQVYDGSVEGTLEMINFHRGANKFNIYPTIESKRVTCHFPASLLNDAIKAVGRYINVSGKLKYKKRDRFPYGIDVASIDIYPNEEELPTIFDLRGISPNLSGEMSSEDFVRKLRDAER